jgi:NAD dependent epimerase/dehydratase family enzyme
LKNDLIQGPVNMVAPKPERNAEFARRSPAQTQAASIGKMQHMALISNGKCRVPGLPFKVG